MTHWGRAMICVGAFPFVQRFLEEINQQLRAMDEEYQLSGTQKAWIAFCIVGIWVTGTLCWKRFEKYSLGLYSHSALSWMLRKSHLAWQALLVAGIQVILKKYSLKTGHLVLDDTDRQRSKSTTRIAQVHKIYDKKTGGYFMGQNLVFLLLVTEKVTIPVGFQFYQPDPKRAVWNRQDEELRNKKVPKSQRPSPPPEDPAFPNKIQIGIQLLNQFKATFPALEVRSISADAAYGSGDFFKQLSQSYPQVQIISQLRENQKVIYRNQQRKVNEVFESLQPSEQWVSIRGGEKKKVHLACAQLRVESHEKNQFVIAVKYEGESNYRYIVASEASWRAIDVVQAYSLRWLVEVFIEDWKRYEGWGQLALQPGVEGSFRGVVLSLLVDLCLLFHPNQFARIKNKQPAWTVGSLREHLKNESLLACFHEILTSNSPMEGFAKLQERFLDLFGAQDSTKHMANRDLTSLQPSSLFKRTFGRLVFGYL